MTQIITAVFDSPAVANLAERDLQEVGIPTSMIARYSPSSRTSSYDDTATTTATTTAPRRGGVLGWLMGEDETDVSRATPSETRRYTPSHFGMTDAEFAEHGDAYENHIRLGHAVMRITPTTQTEVDQIMAVLERHHPGELHTDGNDEIARTTAPAAGLSGTAGTELNTPRGEYTDRTVSGATGVESGTIGRSSGASIREGEEVIPLSEEKVNIGTRRIDRGTTYVRRYVVETPVEKDVVLRDETTSIERRAPLGNTQPGAGAFEERTVEVKESGEVANVSKTARVVEEVVVSRAATERTETVRDVERKEEVEITKGENRGVFPDAPGERRDETIRETDRKTGIG